MSCELTASQQQLIESTVRGMLAMINTSCGFNIIDFMGASVTAKSTRLGELS
jgi:hypothetical protein